jgi:hypothetical protein
MYGGWRTRFDYHEIGAIASERAAPALLPISDLVDRKPEKACEVLLRKLKLLRAATHVDFRQHMKLRPLQLPTCERGLLVLRRSHRNGQFARKILSPPIKLHPALHAVPYHALQHTGPKTSARPVDKVSFRSQLEICSRRAVSPIYPCPGCPHGPGVPVRSLPGRSTATLDRSEHNKAQPHRRGCVSPSC